MRCDLKSISELCCKCQTEERVVVHFILENNRQSAAAGIMVDPLRTGLGSSLSRISRQITTVAPRNTFIQTRQCQCVGFFSP